MKSSHDKSKIKTRIGSLFMAGMPGTEIDAGTESLIRDKGLGGLILFGRNIEDPLQLARLCFQLQELSMAYRRSSLFLAIDQEGGPVARLKRPFTLFPGNAVMAETSDPLSSAGEFARITAEEMTLVGLNMNMAPVLDVRQGEAERHLAGRTFGEDPDLVAELGKVIITGLQEKGVLAVAKHFPGLGKSPLDPHLELPVIDLDKKGLREFHLPPFRTAITAGVSSIMTSHAAYPYLDKFLPATLSRKILSDLLRKNLSFKGLIITDDLEMGAIAKGWGIPEAAADAFEAGADILLICEDQKRVVEAMTLLEERINQGQIPALRLQESVDRIEAARSLFLAGTKEVSFEEIERYFAL